MRVIVTRPAREAQDWVTALRLSGWLAEALPLIEIGPAPDPDVVRRAWSQLDADPQRCLALMFVSANAVEGFFAERPTKAPPLSSMPLQAWATGPGTARALASVGWPAERVVMPAQDAPQFDSEALWARVAALVTPGARVRIVRGADVPDRSDTAAPAHVSASGQPDQVQASDGAGRDWFARQLRAAGVEVDFVVSYQRRSPCWTSEAPQWQRARAAAQGDAVWLFSSSEAVRHLRSLLPDQDWGAARALVTHERIARAARDAGFAEIAVSRPALVDVQNALIAWTGRAPR